MDVRSRLVGAEGSIMKISIIIPAHNEQNRIGKTLDAYGEFFDQKAKQNNFSYELIVVLNGCTDNKHEVVNERKNRFRAIKLIDIPEAGKGLAIKIGFEDALKRANDLIGFVDADMATHPVYFYELIENLDEYDGIIASRYMKGAKVIPPRPAIKEWGRRLVYAPFVWLLFGMRFIDYQCGAKLFKRHVIETITPQLTVAQWAFDVELLYLCKLHGFSIREWPTVWYDQVGSKLNVFSEHRMLTSLLKLRWRHTWLYSRLRSKK